MKLSSTHVIAVTNQKGGCGKTTTALGIGSALAKLGYKVCIVDTDEQCNATQGLGLDADGLAERGLFTIADAYMQKKPLADIAIDFNADNDSKYIFKDATDDTDLVRPGLHLVPAHRGLSAIDKVLDAELATMAANDEFSDLDEDEVKDEQRCRLRESVRSLRGDFDFVIIDCPPSLGFLMTSALIAADWFIIPMFPSGYEMKALTRLKSTVDKTRRRYNPDLQMLGVLLGQTNMRAKLDQQIHKQLINFYTSDLVFPETIPASVRHKEATVFGRTIFEHAEKEAGEPFLAVAEHILKRVSLADAATAASDTQAPTAEVANA